MPILRLKTGAPISVGIGQGRVVEYFDGIRKIVEAATEEVFFIDPYLDPAFVSLYLNQVRTGVAIRLLADADVGRLRAFKARACALPAGKRSGRGAALFGEAA